MVYSEKYLSQFIFDPYVHVLSERIEDLVFNSNISNKSHRTQLCLGEFKLEQNYWLKIGKNYTATKISLYIQYLVNQPLRYVFFFGGNVIAYNRNIYQIH